MSKNPYPMRMCVGCRQSMDKTLLCRVVCTPQGDAIVDKKGNLPGRGAYICLKEECIKSASKKKAFSRALKVKESDSIYEELGKYVFGE